jgi:NADP-dependent 3-hydroxy acid dehydrogenase YdfG
MNSAGRQELTGKTALVTGASSGMGREIAIAFSGAGADVVFTGRDRPRLEAAAAEAPGNTHLLALDVNAPDAPRTLIDDTITAFGRLDLLVHAAGVFLPKPFAQSALADFDRQWETNVRAPYLITQAALPHLQPGAVVIFISSIAGLVGFPNAAGYCATKGAVELMSKALALEFAPIRDPVQLHRPRQHPHADERPSVRRSGLRRGHARLDPVRKDRDRRGRLGHCRVHVLGRRPLRARREHRRGRRLDGRLTPRP